jgi:leucine-zipper of insertion element IS481
MLKPMDVFGRWEAAALTQLKAAEMLGVGERSFHRWCRRHKEEGETGLLDRHVIPAKPRAWMHLFSCPGSGKSDSSCV